MAHFTYDDGGRAKAGYKGKTGDCATRSVAIAAGVPYRWAYDEINFQSGSERPRHGRSRSNARTGVTRRTINSVLTMLGFEWVPTMQIGSGCKVHLREEELPAGRLVVRLSGHYVAVINRVIHDTHDPSRDGTRCVYGYWRKVE